MAKLASNNRQEVEESKTLSKPRIFSDFYFVFIGSVCIIFRILFTELEG